MANQIGANVFCSGSNRGIGFGFIQHLLRESDVKRVFAGVRSPNEATELKKLAQENSKLHIVEFDSLNDAVIEKVVAEVGKVVGDEGLNLLINNAGIFLPEGNDCRNLKREAVLKVLNTNLVGVMISCQFFLPLLKKAQKHSGSPSKILNISSGTGSIDWIQASYYPGHNATYPASKSALNSYTKFLSTSEETKDSIVVIALCPGYVKTDFNEHNGILSVDESVEAILKTIAKVTLGDSGRFMDRFGETVKY